MENHSLTFAKKLARKNLPLLRVRLCALLQVKTASLYYHIKDKEELMQLLSDRISRGMAWPEPSLDWEEQTFQWVEQFRRVLSAAA